MAMWRCCSLCVLLVALLTYWLSAPVFSATNLVPDLRGQVAVVTGASRGIGKGIAVGLGEAGATVYVTARTSKSQPMPEGQRPAPGTIEDTCEAVERAGGRCHAVAADSGKDDHLEKLIDRVWQEQGRLDLLVNNAFAAVSFLPQSQGKAFWEKGIEAWDWVNHVGLRSHYVASVLAAKKMSQQKRGLIINIGSFGGVNYIFDVAYGIGKAAMDRMANDMAIELFTENITMVSLWPGLVKTEHVEGGALTEVAAKERRGQPPGMPATDFQAWMDTPLAETPLFNGRVVAALARDRRMLDHTGKVLIPSLMAYDYGIVDERGVRSPSMTSVKSMLAGTALKSLLQSWGLWKIPGGCYIPQAEASDNAKLFWNRLPDLSFPGKLLKLSAGAPNL